MTQRRRMHGIVSIGMPTGGLRRTRGYAELLRALKNRKHPEHKSMKEWLGRPFDPELFEVAKTNTWLRKLKWPRVTEGQLRKVLMSRDAYHE